MRMSMRMLRILRRAQDKFTNEHANVANKKADQNNQKTKSKVYEILDDRR
jgi:hypothetical protein